MPLRLRVTRSVTLRILTLVWVLFALTFAALMMMSVRELHVTLLDKGRLQAGAIADLLEYAFEPLLERGDLLSIQRCAENAATIPGVERVWLVGRDGKILAADDPTLVGRAVPADPRRLTSVLDGADPEHVWQEGRRSGATLNLIKPLRGGGFDPRESTDLIAAAWVQVSLRPLYRQVASSVSRLALVALLSAGLLSLAVGWVLSHTVSRPLVELARASSEVARGRLDAAVPVRSRDEIGQLARNFQTMTRALSEARREMEDFLHLVSHDLRAPLVNIEGFVERLRRSLEEIRPSLEAAFPPPVPAVRSSGAGARPLPAPLTPRDWAERVAPECLEFVLMSAERIRHLMEGLLKLSRPLVREPEIAPVELAAIVERVLDGLRSRIEERSVRVEVGPLPAVESDELLLTEVFTNLIQNALDYMGTQRQPRVAIAAARQGEEWRISIADNGRGIAADQRPRLFLPFQRFSPGDGKGEGIGLCLVRRILKGMGGSIGVESEPGRGSTFFFTLPVEPLPRRPSDPRSPRTPAGDPGPQGSGGAAPAGSAPEGGRAAPSEAEPTTVRG